MPSGTFMLGHSMKQNMTVRKALSLHNYGANLLLRKIGWFRNDTWFPPWKFWIPDLVELFDQALQGGGNAAGTHASSIWGTRFTTAKKELELAHQEARLKAAISSTTPEAESPAASASRSPSAKSRSTPQLYSRGRLFPPSQ